jgi:hypothetical protein
VGMAGSVKSALDFLRVKHYIPQSYVSMTPSGPMYTVDTRLLTEEQVLDLAVAEGFDEANLE